MRNADREAVWNKTNRRIGEWVEVLDWERELKGLEGGVMDSVFIRLPSEDRPEALLVLKAHVGEQRYVSFAGALTVGQALLTWRAKAMGTGLKWREDVPWSER